MLSFIWTNFHSIITTFLCFSVMAAIEEVEILTNRVKNLEGKYDSSRSS